MFHIVSHFTTSDPVAVERLGASCPVVSRSDHAAPVALMHDRTLAERDAMSEQDRADIGTINRLAERLGLDIHLTIAPHVGGKGF